MDTNRDALFPAASGIGAMCPRYSERLPCANKSREATLIARTIAQRCALRRSPRSPSRCTHTVAPMWYLNASRGLVCCCAKLLWVFALASVSTRAGIYLTDARAFALGTNARWQPLAQNVHLNLCTGMRAGHVARCSQSRIH